MSGQVDCHREKRRRRLRLGAAVEGILQNEDGAELEGLLKDMKLAAGLLKIATGELGREKI